MFLNKKQDSNIVEICLKKTAEKYNKNSAVLTAEFFSYSSLLSKSPFKTDTHPSIPRTELSRIIS